MELNGKVAVVTGGAGGIGVGLVRMLLGRGCHVGILDIVDDLGKEAEKDLRGEFGEGRVMYVKCDVSKRDQLERAYNNITETLGAIRVVCNMAGIHDDYVNPGRMVDVNLTGVINGTLLAIERMRQDQGGPGGVVVNTASFAGLWPYWIFPAYSATKAGVISFTRAYSLHPDQENMGVRFNTICPSTVHVLRQNNMEGKILSVESLRALNKSEGFLEVDEVSALICRLVEEPHNGAVAAISKNDGIVFHELPTKILF